MLQQKHLHPDAPLPGVTTTPAPQTTTPTIPAADADFSDVASAVATNWLATPAITLLWKKSSDFAADVSAYGSSLTGKLSSGSLRSGQTFTLKQLDKQMDDAVKEVKVYIERKYKTTGAPAQFARYGIVKENGSLRMSRDRNSRKEALKLMSAAIAADGFSAEEFGTTFWTDMQTNYTQAMEIAGSTSGDLSSKVATKNELRASIRKVMAALLLVLKANYPDTYKGVYRQWGWKKEGY